MSWPEILFVVLLISAAIMYWYITVPVIIIIWWIRRRIKEGPRSKKGRFADEEYIRQLQEIDSRKKQGKKEADNGTHFAPPKESTQQKTVCYIIIKDGLGKFGITKKRDSREIDAVYRRYKNEPLTVLWTTTLSSRGQAFDFEEYCKTRVKILAAREWFNQDEADRLVKDVIAAGY